MAGIHDKPWQLAVTEEDVAKLGRAVQELAQCMQSFAVSMAGAEAAFRELFEHLPAGESGPPGAVACEACKTENLQVYFTSKRDGTILCQACFDLRSANGRARETVDGERFPE